MMMKLELIGDLAALYPDFRHWWEARGVAPIPMPLLPKLGILVRGEAGEPIAAVWLYMDNSISLGFLTWFITRPGLPGRTAKAALEHLMKFMAAEAGRLGVTHLIASSGAGGLSRLIQQHGYAVAGQGITHHFKQL
jgi:hypothetical protein